MSNRKRYVEQQERDKHTYSERRKMALEDGLYFKGCINALEEWDEDWVCCPVCGGPIVESEITGELMIEHDHSVDTIEH